MPWRFKPDLAALQEVPESDGGDDILASRLEELTHREVALRRITEVVERQRSRLEERERALQSSTSRAAADAEKRLAQAVLRADRAEQRVRELEEQVAALDAAQPPEPNLEFGAEREVAPVPAWVTLPPPDETDGYGNQTYMLQGLERFVREAQLRGDPRAEEWAMYVPLLREHAEPDGRLPSQFAPLIDSIFAA
jgi:hypothetical protein